MTLLRPGLVKTEFVAIYELPSKQYYGKNLKIIILIMALLDNAPSFTSFEWSFTSPCTMKHLLGAWTTAPTLCRN